MIRKLASLATALLLFAPALFAATPVNINTADATTLASSLDRVGAAKAQAIVDYRDANGPFKSADELAQVKGIGKATIDLNRSAIQLSDDEPEAEVDAEPAAKPSSKTAKVVATPRSS